MKNFVHQPVLLKEVVKLLCPSRGKVFVDGTLGLGGHSRALLDRGAKIIAIDKDSEAIEQAKINLGKYKNIQYFRGNFSDIGKFLNKINISKVDGILLDLGVSSMQLDNLNRGFSFKGGKLDMRMDKNQNLTAQEVLNNYSEDDLVRIFSDYGEERYSRRIARAIVDSRVVKSINSVDELVDIIKMVVPVREQHKKRHFATNVFRALRMEVNGEVKDLIDFINVSYQLVNPGGKILVIGFHSIEDRIAKRGLKELKLKGKVEILTKKPIIPSYSEIINNPRSRSAKLRACKVL